MKNKASILLLLLVISCKPEDRKNPELFTLLSHVSTHVNFINHLTESEKQNIIEYLYFNNGGGVAAGDINNDGLADLYFTSNQKTHKLYMNKWNFNFEDK